ncbi:hypothetical protein KAR10_02435 [bacterium]|nr:hypothetical protein [bacterium]
MSYVEIAQTDKKKKTIFCLLIECGSGHRVPCISLSSYFDQNCYGKYNIEICDFIRDLGFEKIDSIYKLFWKYCLKNKLIYKFIYKCTDTKSFSALWYRLVLRVTENKLLEYIDKLKPDAIFCTSPNVLWLIDHFKKEKKINLPVIVFNTDAFTVHSKWCAPSVDMHLISSIDGKKSLLDKGIPLSKITYIPYIIRPTLTNYATSANNSAPHKEAIGIPRNLFTVLLMAGGEGIGDIYNLVKEIRKTYIPIHLIIITGRNDHLFEKLSEFIRVEGLNTYSLFGFVENIEPLFHASDLAMGKAGVNFIFECLAIRLPIIITTCMENERGAMDFVINNKLGWVATKPKATSDILNVLLRHRHFLEAARNNIQKFNFMDGAAKTTDCIEHLISKYEKSA